MSENIYFIHSLLLRIQFIDFSIVNFLQVMCKSLKKLYFYRIWSKIGIFDPRIPIGNFIGLESLEFHACSGFVSLFSNSTCRVIPNLRELHVGNCEMLQEVIAKDNEEQTNSKVTLFPQLKEMKLANLPEMRQFCHMNHGIELPSLEFLEISWCPLMETFSRNTVNLSSSGVFDSNIGIQSFFDEVQILTLL